MSRREAAGGGGGAGDPAGRAEAAARLVGTNPPLAQAVALEAVALARAAGDAGTAARAHRAHGRAALELGRLDEATRSFRDRGPGRRAGRRAGHRGRVPGEPGVRAVRARPDHRGPAASWTGPPRCCAASRRPRCSSSAGWCCGGAGAPTRRWRATGGRCRRCAAGRTGWSRRGCYNNRSLVYVDRGELAAAEADLLKVRRAVPGRGPGRARRGRRDQPRLRRVPARRRAGRARLPRLGRDHVPGAGGAAPRAAADPRRAAAVGGRVRRGAADRRAGDRAVRRGRLAVAAGRGAAAAVPGPAGRRRRGRCAGRGQPGRHPARPAAPAGLGDGSPLHRAAGGGAGRSAHPAAAPAGAAGGRPAGRDAAGARRSWTPGSSRPGSRWPLGDLGTVRRELAQAAAARTRGGTELRIRAWYAEALLRLADRPGGRRPSRRCGPGSG